MILFGTHQWPLYTYTLLAYVACAPFNPFRYPSINWRERAQNLWIERSGTNSRASTTFCSKSASLDDAGNFWYVLLDDHQHCSIGLSSGWNLGKKTTPYPRALQKSSRREGTFTKSGSLKRIWRQQQSTTPAWEGGHLNFAHSASFPFVPVHPV